MSYMRQLAFSFYKNHSTESGGSLFIGKRKTKRVLSVKTPIHLVLKSDKAKGIYSFVNHSSSIQNLISKFSKKHGVKIYSRAFNFNHIHLVMTLKTIDSYKCWIRELTKEIVNLLVNRTKTQLNNFFTLRPYTRLLTWGRQFKLVLEYLILNQMEVFGVRPSGRKFIKPTKEHLGFDEDLHTKDP